MVEWRSRGGGGGCRSANAPPHNFVVPLIGLTIIPFHYPPVQGADHPYGVKEILVVNGRA